MNRRYFFVLALVAAALVLPHSAIAQEAPGANATEGEQFPIEECDVRVDSETRICESSFQDGRLELLIHSNTSQTVTMTDMGARGHVPREQRTLQEGRNRVSIEGTEVNNKAGVGISTDRALYRHVIKTGSPIIAGPFDQNDVQISAIAGALWVALVVVLQSYRYATGRDNDPERVA